MPTITSSGIGSGIDINSLVNQLVELERRPLNAVNDKIASIDSQVSAYGRFKSSMSDFQTAMKGLSTASKFQVFSTTSSNEGVVSATASETASIGTADINVTQLAERNKVATSAFANGSTVIGEGNLAINVGSNAFNITIDATNSTLNGIRDAINSAADNTGVTATVLTDDAGSRLILTADDTGSSNAVSVAVTGATGNLSQMDSANMSTIQAAQDATLTIDGFAVTSSSNKVTGALQGVTLDLKSTGASTINLARDDTTITESVQAFVDAFNDIRDTISGLRDRELAADSTLLTIDRQIMSELNSAISISGGSYSYLTEVGVEMDRYGKMQLNSDNLQNALNKDFEGFSKLFSDSTDGIAVRLDTLAGNVLATDGLIDSREDGLGSQRRSLVEQADRIDRRLVSTEARLRAQFTAMDKLVASLNSTGDFLSQQLKNLPSANQSS